MILTWSPCLIPTCWETNNTRHGNHLCTDCTAVCTDRPGLTNSPYSVDAAVLNVAKNCCCITPHILWLNRTFGIFLFICFSCKFICRSWCEHAQVHECILSVTKNSCCATVPHLMLFRTCPKSADSTLPCLVRACCNLADSATSGNIVCRTWYEHAPICVLCSHLLCTRVQLQVWGL